MSHACRVGDVVIGGGAPVVVQSMTNTDTADAAATAHQVAQLAEAGSEVVRITVNNRASAARVAEIRDRLRDVHGVEVPLVGDFHYNGHTLLTEFPEAADALAKFRINPGNVGRGARHDANFATMVRAAVDHGKPVRIGVNAGSLDPELLDRLMDENGRRDAPLSAEEVLREAMVQSALTSAEAAEELGLPADRIVISCKVSRLQEMVAVYRDLAARCAYPLHLGLTEAGMGSKGIVATTAALAILLQDGIGDTIRASLTPEPGGDRAIEVRVCRELLQSLGLRSFRPHHLDTSQTEAPRARRLAEEIARVVRGRLTNPRWIVGMLAHGHRGVAEIAQGVDSLYAFAATANAVPGPLFDATHAALIADDAVREAMIEKNPAAAAAIAARLRDALARGLWQTRRNSVERELDLVIAAGRS